MEPRVLPIRDLYERDPGLYDALSARDFAAQADVLLKLLRRKAPRILELFAGPARHARALKAAGAEVRAVDDSLAMRRYALAEGGLEPREYVKARLPRLPALGRFDAALLLQFAAGILEPDDLELLLRRLARHLKPGGLVLFELRRPSVLRDCDRPGSVETVTIDRGDGRVARLTCPDGAIAWSDDDWTMDLTMRVELPGETRRYRMSERLVVPAQLRRMARRTSLYVPLRLPPEAEDVFAGGSLVALRYSARR